MTLEDNIKMTERINKDKIKHLRSIGYVITVAKKKEVKKERKKYTRVKENKRLRQVLDTETGIIFPQINEAAEDRYIPYTTLCNQLIRNLRTDLVYLEETWNTQI